MRSSILTTAIAMAFTILFIQCYTLAVPSPITATIETLGNTGSITVTSNLPVAYVSLDGNGARTTPWTYAGVPVGSHQIEVSYPGYQVFVTSVNVTSGSTIPVVAELAPIPNPGLIYVDSSPRGADVYVDGNFEGDAPVTVGGLAPGTHQVNLFFIGYEPYSSMISVQAGQTTTLSATLVQGPSRGMGTIGVSTQPPGASIYLDGAYEGFTVRNNIIDIIGVPSGSHVLEFRLNGFENYQTTVQVNVGESTFSSPILVPLQQPPLSGTILITSDPAGAQVYLDDQFQGIAPITIPAVAAGSHTLALRLPGYQDFTTTVQVQAGQVTMSTFALVPVTASPTVPLSSPPTSTSLPAFIAVAALAAIVFIARKNGSQR
jgi:hypothetical protein